jgi:hypothetical protein
MVPSKYEKVLVFCRVCGFMVISRMSVAQERMISVAQESMMMPRCSGRVFILADGGRGHGRGRSVGLD